MFKSRGLTMDGDHVDVSFRRPESWPAMPWKSIRGVMFRMGDPKLGPSVNLAVFTPHDDEPLDWAHTIDPMHFHGTDQFRLEVEGTWVTTRQAFGWGGFLYQEAGRVYQEHPGDDDHSWLVLVYGDKRGEPATLTLKGDRAELLKDGVTELGGALLAVGEYPHPAGPKGLPAIASTAGQMERGHLWGSFSDVAEWPSLTDGIATTSAVFGDPGAGPLVCMLKAAAGGTLVPACTYDTEVFLAVSRGSCEIGGTTYVTGDMRVQAAGSSMPPIVAGPEGADVTLIFGDRRGILSATADGNEAIAWLQHLEGVRAELTGALVGRN